jgi:ATP-dependent DNA helicase RecG
LITLGLINQHDAVTATELVRLLSLADAEELRPWLGRLREWELVGSRGQTRATEYFVTPEVLRRLQFKGPTTLKGIERHRLRELILRDLAIYETASISELHGRIGKEIPRRRIQRLLAELSESGEIRSEGEGRGRKYVMVPKAAE